MTYTKKQIEQGFINWNKAYLENKEEYQEIVDTPENVVQYSKAQAKDLISFIK